MKIRKLRKSGLKELRVRGRQFFSTMAERQGRSSLNVLPTDQALLGMLNATHGSAPSSAEDLFELFKRRIEPRFFAAFTERESTIEEIQRRLPHQSAKIIERANAILCGRFNLLGYEDLTFGDPVDWHFEPVSNKRSPNLHWSRLNFLDANVVGDKKIIWELSRHQYFVTLGQAYWLTGDERYAQAFVSHLNWWMDQNPPKMGINWASSLEVAFRSISWIWAFYFFKESTALTVEAFTRALKFLYLHARHIETYLSTYFSPNTHLTGEALGLFYLGTFLLEFKDSERWRNTGFEILTEQLSKHVKPDGVYFEQSSYYHRYTTDFYLHFLILLRLSAEQIPHQLEKSLTALLDHLMYITRPDGCTPLFGDDDGGRLVTLTFRAPNDFRATLATGAALFGRADYKYVAGDAIDEAIWLLGANDIRRMDHIEAQVPSQQSVAFKDGGYYLMRDGWATTSNYLWFDSGPHGTLNCGHAHADALSFELVTGGRSMLLDPGTYTYTGSDKMRDWFRSSAAHNTVTIDGKSSSLPAGPFSWKTIARTETLKWISRDRFDFIESSHDGYTVLPQPAYLSRSVMFLKHDYWILRDKVISGGEHTVDLRFHFAPRTNPLINVTEKQAMVSVGGESGSGGLDVYVFGNEGCWRREEAWTSPCYGKKVRARVYAFSALINGNGELVTFLLPLSGDMKSEPVIRAVEAIGGKAFEVTHPKGIDIVMIRADNCSVVETARISSDYEWTWARFSDNNESLPEEFVLLGGQNLSIEGSEILKSDRHLNYLAGQKLGKTFQVEIEDGTFDLNLPIKSFESCFASSIQHSKI